MLNKHPANWKGEEASYLAKHDYIQYHYGKPSLCENCGTTTAKKYEWANISGEHKRDRTDYIRLCTSCHRKYDNSKKPKKQFCKHGHEYTPENTYISKITGYRFCRMCHRNQYIKLFERSL